MRSRCRRGAPARAQLGRIVPMPRSALFFVTAAKVRKHRRPRTDNHARLVATTLLASDCTAAVALPPPLQRSRLIVLSLDIAETPSSPAARFKGLRPSPCDGIARPGRQRCAGVALAIARPQGRRRKRGSRDAASAASSITPSNRTSIAGGTTSPFSCAVRRLRTTSA